MGKRSFNLQFIMLLITVIILYSLVPILPRLISNYFTTYSYLIVLALCIVLIMLYRGKSSLSEYIVLIIPFALWKVYDLLVSKSSIINWAYQALLDFSPIIIGLFITRRLGRGEIKYFTIVILLAILVTGITTYIGVAQNPNAARYLATVADSNEALYVRYNMLNIGGYDFVYTTTLLYPLLIYAYKIGKINLFFCLLFSILELFFIIMTGYTTALILWLLSTIFIFFRKDLSLSNLIVFSVIAVLMIFVFFNLVSEGLKALADIIGSKDISERLYAMAGGKAGMESLDDDRMGVWMKSVNEFLAHPILGNLSFVGGGHSFILDTLAKFGLVGGSIITMLYVIIFRRFFLPHKQYAGYGYIVWSFIQTLILSFLNPSMWLNVLCLFILVILAFLNRSEDKNESSLDSKLNIKRIRRANIR